MSDSLTDDQNVDTLGNENQHKSRTNKIPKLKAVTSRHTPKGYEAIKIVSSDKGVSMSEVIRICVAGRLKKYFGEVVYIYTDPEDLNRVKVQLAQIFDQIQDINSNLNRMGNNYNQIAKIKNIQRKMESTTRYSDRYDELSQQLIALQNAEGCVSDEMLNNVRNEVNDLKKVITRLSWELGIEKVKANGDIN